eukprot:CAMPEP_0195521386 /NCGR_PEP_ID=MMETSP0794_2-20130614/18573_1 /TAXON_ID=515487 /ORGANISM="Stephanopyxis turris, Strain CCMP 815" /LENGTH=519 /DNA_ID=CAMNT_0040650927 /DNA_START=124 /DNA_END=1683 /DNA_ORIENTATION=+
MYSTRTNLPLYQIDFTAAYNGKKIGLTKRRITWKFGFADSGSLQSGLIGVDARGQEHEVVIVWSITSGKRQVLLDGHVIHMSTASKNQGKFQFCFQMKGNHMIKLTAHAGPPMNANGIVQRQFDMVFDGLSFFDFPKIYQLGADGNYMEQANLKAFSPPPSSQYVLEKSRSKHYHHSSSSAYRREQQSERESQFSRLKFAQTSSFPLVVSPTSSAANVYQQGWGKEVHEPPAKGNVTPEAKNNAAPIDILSQPQSQSHPWPDTNPSVDTSFQSMFFSQVQNFKSQSQSHPWSDTNPSVNTSFQPNEFSQVQNFELVSSEIMSTYQDCPQDNFIKETTSTGSTKIVTANVPHSSSQTTTRLLTMNPRELETFENDNEQDFEHDKDEIEKAMKKLVNLGDITTAPEEEKPLRLTMTHNEKATVSMNKNKREKNIQSRGIPPKSGTWNDARSSLTELKAITKTNTSNEREVMKPPPVHEFNPALVQAGSLVVYGVSQHGGKCAEQQQYYGQQHQCNHVKVRY